MAVVTFKSVRNVKLFNENSALAAFTCVIYIHCMGLLELVQSFA